MKPIFFIRTYPADFGWLTYCLRSIAKHGQGWPVIVASPSFEGFNKPALPVARYATLTTQRHPEGYIDQQITKLRADLGVAESHPDATHIIHIDSDTVLIDDPLLLFKGEKPYLLYTPYRDLPPEVQVWKRATERHLGVSVENEYMRRLPLVYPVGVYAAARQRLEMVGGPSWPSRIVAREFSEFNVLGVVAHGAFMRDFEWVDTTRQGLPPNVALQHWSWGGIEKHRDELERLFPAT
jgi:hypothetical protein